MDKDVPMTVFEYTMARFERTIKRLTILLIIAMVLLFATNVMWLYTWNQYDYADVTVDTEQGNANYVNAGANGVINNAKDSGEKQDQEKQEKCQTN